MKSSKSFKRSKKPPPERDRVTVERSSSGSIKSHRDSIKIHEASLLSSQKRKSLDSHISNISNEDLDDSSDMESIIDAHNTNTSDRPIHVSSSSHTTTSRKRSSLVRPYAYDKTTSFKDIDDTRVQEESLSSSKKEKFPNSRISNMYDEDIDDFLDMESSALDTNTSDRSTHSSSSSRKRSSVVRPDTYDKTTSFKDINMDDTCLLKESLLSSTQKISLDSYISSMHDVSLDDLLDDLADYPHNKDTNAPDRSIHSSGSHDNRNLSQDERPDYDKGISFASDDIILDDDLLTALAHKNDELLAKQNEEDLRRYEEELYRNKRRERNVKVCFAVRVCVVGVLVLASVGSLVYYIFVSAMFMGGSGNDDRATTTTTTRVAETMWKEEKYIERITDVCHKVGSSSTMTDRDHNNHPLHHHNVVKCSQLCASKMCCFGTTTTSDSNNTTPSTTCLDDDDNNNNIHHHRSSSSSSSSSSSLPSSCDAYAPCAILNTMNDDRSLVDVGVVTATCSVQNIRRNEGFGICQRLCAKRACCFLPPPARQQREEEEEKEEELVRGGGGSSGGSCDSVNVEWCREFEACRNLLKVRPWP